MSKPIAIPLTQATQVAQNVRYALQPYTHRIEIAGSIRRRQPYVHDIEIVAIPIPVQQTLDRRIIQPYLLDHFLNEINGQSINLTKDGPRFKQFAFSTKLGFTYRVDLFLVTDPTEWGYIYAIRTGSSEFSKWLVTPRKHGGAKPDHIRIYNRRLYDKDKRIPTPEETYLFEALQIPTYPAPDRQRGPWHVTADTDTPHNTHNNNTQEEKKEPKPKPNLNQT